MPGYETRYTTSFCPQAVDTKVHIPRAVDTKVHIANGVRNVISLTGSNNSAEFVYCYVASGVLR